MIKINKNRILFFVAVVILIILAMFIAFYNLDAVFIERWDEARHGISAYEMIKNNDYLVNTCNYEPDYWNLKPPLSFWGIVAGFKMFGINAFGLKFCSALSFVLLFGVSIAFASKRFGKAAGICSGIFILGLYILVDGHTVRFADADMLYCLFYICCFVCFVQSDKHPWLFPLSGLFVALAFLTKSYHAGTIFICLVINFIAAKYHKAYKLKHYIGFICCAACPVLVWGALRYMRDGTTFFYNMLVVDVLSRSANAVENHEGPITYYILALLSILKTQLLLGIGAAMLMLIKRKKIVNKDTAALLIWGLVPVILFSLVKSKLVWYVYPQVFILAILMAVFFSQVFKCSKIIYGIAVTALLLPGRYIYSNINHVLNWKDYNENEISRQAFLANTLDYNHDFSMKNMYFEVEEVGNSGKKIKYESPPELNLIAEMYGDMRCLSGGVDAFLEYTDNCFLLVSGDVYSANKSELFEYVLSTDGNTYFLAK